MSKELFPPMTRRNAMLAGGAALTAPFIAPPPLRAQPGPVRIAGLLSLTGGGAAFGSSCRQAHQAVIDEVNAAGGVLGRKIEYFFEDDQTNPEAGVRAARKLIDVDKVAAIMTVWASSVGAAVLPLCWENKVMMLGVTAADSLAELPHQGYFVRTQPHTALQADQFAAFAIRNKAQHFYLMIPQTPFTETVITRIRALCEPKGVKVSSVIYDGKKNSFRSEVDEMVRAKPDVLFIGGYQPDDIVMAKDLFRADFKGKVIGFAFGVTPQFIDGAGKEAAEGIYSLEPVPARGSAAYARLKKIIGKDAIDPYTCQAYDHANLAILAIAKAGAATGTAIRDNIRKIANNDSALKVDNALDGLKALSAGKEIKYAGASGSCKFAENGNIVEVEFRINQIRGGKIVEDVKA
jgi:branched-chain amino acid transport system substrate-binding protein